MTAASRRTAMCSTVAGLIAGTFAAPGIAADPSDTRLIRLCGQLDALQEAFVKVLRSEGALEKVDEPLRWLYRVVDRCCFDALRKKRRSVESPLEDDDRSPTMASAHPSVDIEMRDAVLRLLATLSEDEMRIALLLFVDGMSQGEIADEMSLSRVTINKKVQAIRARAEMWLGKARPAEATS